MVFDLKCRKKNTISSSCKNHVKQVSYDNLLRDCSFKIRIEDTRSKQTPPHHVMDRLNTSLNPVLLEMTTSQIFFTADFKGIKNKIKSDKILILHWHLSVVFCSVKQSMTEFVFESTGTCTQQHVTNFQNKHKGMMQSFAGKYPKSIM